MIEIKNVNKEFEDGGEKFLALKDTNVTIKEQEFTAVIGPSGSGKSTFLTILGALQQPTKGHLVINERDVYKLSENERSDLRFKDIGFILQGSNLVPFLTLHEQYSLKLKNMKKRA